MIDLPEKILALFKNDELNSYAYVTFKEKDGTKNRSYSALIRGCKIEKELDNVFQTGFSLTDKCSSESIFIKHPTGFIFDLKTADFLKLCPKITIINGSIQEALAFTKLHSLLTEKEYLELKKEESEIVSSFEIGRTYKALSKKSGEEEFSFLFLGKVNYISSNDLSHKYGDCAIIKRFNRKPNGMYEFKPFNKSKLYNFVETDALNGADFQSCLEVLGDYDFWPIFTKGGEFESKPLKEDEIDFDFNISKWNSSKKSLFFVKDNIVISSRYKNSSYGSSEEALYAIDKRISGIYDLEKKKKVNIVDRDIKGIIRLAFTYRYEGEPLLSVDSLTITSK